MRKSWFFWGILLSTTWSWAETPTTLESFGKKVILDGEKGILTLIDEKSGLTFVTEPLVSSFQVRNIEQKGAGLTYELHGERLEKPISIRWEVEPSGEVVFHLRGEGKWPGAVEYPPAWKLGETETLLLPIGLGVAWPGCVPEEEDAAFFQLKKSLFWSRNLTMG
ncbi:MAG: hypothetical protein Q4E67_02580, partial [Planctomycetia bacterium]|nr:hypothetical protein [Planctomycetia bacterium]